MIMFISFLEICIATIWIDDPSFLRVGGGGWENMFSVGILYVCWYGSEKDKIKKNASHKKKKEKEKKE